MSALSFCHTERWPRSRGVGRLAAAGIRVAEEIADIPALVKQALAEAPA